MNHANDDPKSSSQSQPVSSEEQTAEPGAASQQGSAQGFESNPDTPSPRATQYSSKGRGQRRIKGIAESAVSAQAKAYNSVFEAVAAIIIAALIGWFTDDYFETKPRYLIIGVIIGFAAFVLRLVRMAKIYQESLEASDDQNQSQIQSQTQDHGNKSRKESETDER